MSDEIKKRMVIPSGVRFVVTSGQYSDYHLMASYEAIEEIDTEKVLDEYLADKPEQREQYKFEEEEFIAWLDASRKLKCVEQWEWNVSSYGCIDKGYLKNEKITYVEDEDNEE